MSLNDKSFDNTSRDMRKSYDYNLGKSAKKTRDASHDRNLNKSATKDRTPRRQTSKNKTPRRDDSKNKTPRREDSKNKTPRRDLSKSGIKDRKSVGSRDKSPLKKST